MMPESGMEEEWPLSCEEAWGTPSLPRFSALPSRVAHKVGFRAGEARTPTNAIRADYPRALVPGSVPWM